MSHIHRQLKLPPYQKKKNHHAHCFEGQFARTLKMSSSLEYPDLPEGVQPLENQVAGHAFQQGTDNIGLLKNASDGSVLKPAGKLLCGTREIKFYEEVQAATKETDLVTLKGIIPQYMGHLNFPVDGKPVQFLKLSDLTYGMLEPCIMDVKIGSQTWDPLANEEKRKSEESKYQACKKHLGLCIPGFQVYSIANGRVMRYGKEYGKKLTAVTVKDAFRKFLNAESGLCRQLLIQFLSDLWTIQKWARMQTTFRLYASSVLLVYDARRLKPMLQHQSKSLNSINSKPSASNSCPSSPTEANSCTNSPRAGSSSPLQTSPTGTDSGVEPLQQYFKIQRSHSAMHNYEEEMKAMRDNYILMRDNLVGSYDNKVWASARMIDFAHVFPAEEDTVDNNYLQGIDSLVKIFECFLRECEAENAPKLGVP
ncbi:inositol polyphosphate multikinase [Sabethes cyaneus]|uniref:inositol polyphosphate multikinase n=1 Tax=Sabethes cyaneus TaxID=53552 RepID=UPI00237E0DF4|nr:inositol polyphosphate multikinase [Sabethes cyaneus]XP_053687515.1 inositol polyphosphate multikinase [Sabethes cyaneus]